MMHREIGGWRIRWDERLAQRAYADGWWSRESMGAALAALARDDPQKIVAEEGDLRICAGALYDRAALIARSLLARFAPGSVVSFMLPNWHEAMEIYFAASLAGMVVNPILPSLRENDLAFLLDDIDCRMIFVPCEYRGHDYPAMLCALRAKLRRSLEIVVLRGEAGAETPYAALMACCNASMTAPQVDPDGVAMIMYTSGTTGQPKGVLHSANTLRAIALQLGRYWHVGKGDRFLVASPISHIGGSIYAFDMPVLVGTTAVLFDRWDARDAVGTIDARGITHMAGATPFLEGLLAAAIELRSRCESLRLFICGGASVSSGLIVRALTHFRGAAVSRIYGATEVPATTVGVPDRAEAEGAADTDGKPGIAEVRLGDQNEILMAGPQMFLGYHRARGDEEAFSADGFYRSGDQGAWRDGYLMVTGRIKDLIIRNGENIAPKEIEDILSGHPQIAEIAVVGLPDDRTGERACAAVVPEPGAAPNLAGLCAYLEGLGVARFKWPEEIVIFSVLPKNDAGKVLKEAIRATLVRLDGRASA